MAFEFWFEHLQLLIFSVAYAPLSFQKFAVYWRTVNCSQYSSCKLDKISDETTSLFAMIPWSYLGQNHRDIIKVYIALHSLQFPSHLVLCKKSGFNDLVARKHTKLGKHKATFID